MWFRLFGLKSHPLQMRAMPEKAITTCLGVLASKAPGILPVGYSANIQMEPPKERPPTATLTAGALTGEDGDKKVQKALPKALSSSPLFFYNPP